MVIDGFGEKSGKSDIVIYDAHRQASFFRKVFPVEIVYAVIEVKTSMGSTELGSFLCFRAILCSPDSDNIGSVGLSLKRGIFFTFSSVGGIFHPEIQLFINLRVRTGTKDYFFHNLKDLYPAVQNQTRFKTRKGQAKME